MRCEYFVLVAILTVLIISGCGQQTDKDKTFSDIVISKVYYNGFCLGGCVGNLTITEGKASYYEKIGDNYTIQKEGIFSIEDKTFSDLVALFKTSGFLDLNDKYMCENAPTDVGGYTYTFDNGVTNKSVWVYGGCELPSQLKEIDDKLNNISSSLRPTESCAKEGKQFSEVYKNDYPEHCCGNLTEFASGMDTRISIADKCYQTGMLSGLPVGTCINCGNGICEDIEDPCNCPSDCIGKNRSEYLSVQEFCEKAPESYCEHADSNLNDNLVDLCKSC